MSKVKIATLIHTEKKVHGDNQITLTLIGHNTNGNRAEVEIERMPTYMACHIASSCTLAIKQVRDNMNRELQIIQEDSAQ
jgi:hypothetical protein